MNTDPKNSSVLNNLSNIKKEKGFTEQAFDLIQRAYEIEPDDEIISRNYNNLLSIVQEKEEIERKHQSALKLLERENDFVIIRYKKLSIESKIHKYALEISVKLLETPDQDFFRISILWPAQIPISKMVGFEDGEEQNINGKIYKEYALFIDSA